MRHSSNGNVPNMFYLHIMLCENKHGHFGFHLNFAIGFGDVSSFILVMPVQLKAKAG